MNTNGKTQMKKCQKIEHIFFNDPLSPWKLSSTKIQKLFSPPDVLAKELGQKRVNIKGIKGNFPSKKTSVNMCGQVIEKGSFYYVCRTCIPRNGAYSFPYYCFNCFDQSKHMAHNFQKRFNEEVHYFLFCDCGKRGSCKQESFCGKHKQIFTIKQDVITNDLNGKQFLAYYESLLQIQAFFQFFTIKSNILKQVREKLCSLMKNSVYYTRLVVKILMTPNNFLTQHSTLLELLEDRYQIQPIIWLVFQDLPSMVQLCKILFAKNSSIQFVQPIIQLMWSQQLMMKFYEEGLYLRHFGFKYSSFQLQNQKPINGFILYTLNSYQNHIQVLRTLSHIQPILSQFMGNSIIKGTIKLAEIQKYSRMIKNPQQPKINAKLSQHDDDYKQVLINSMKILGNFYSCSEGVQKFAQRLKNPQKQGFLLNLCQNFHQFLHQPQVLGVYKCPYQGIKCLFILISKSQNKEIYVEQLWKNIFHHTSYFPEFCQTSIKIWSLIHQIPLDFLNQKIKDGQVLKSYECKPLRKDLKGFLYSFQKDEIKTQVLWQKNLRKQLQFMGAKDVIFENCYIFKWPNNKKVFKLRKSKDYGKSPFKINESTQNCPKILAQLQLDYYCSKSKNPSFEPIQNQLFALLFGNKVYLSKFQQFGKLMSQNYQDIDSKTENLFCFLSLLLSKIPFQKQPNLYKNTVEQLRIYYQGKNKEKGKCGDFIKSIMCLDQTLSEHERTRIEYSDRLCGICQKKGKTDDFVILCYISKGECFASLYHKDQDKSKVLIETCNHTVHLSCCQSVILARKTIYCPNCGNISNCLLPLSVETSSKSLREACFKTIDKVMKRKGVAQNENCFLLFTKHLVQSMGLNSLPPYPYQRANQKKLNETIWKLLYMLFNEENSQHQNTFSHIFESFMKKIQSCGKHVLQTVQITLAQLFWSGLNNSIEQSVSQEDLADRVRQLKKYIEQEEYLILKSQIDNFLGYNFMANQSARISMDKQRISLQIGQVPHNAQLMNDMWVYRPKCCNGNDPDSSYYCLFCEVYLCQICDINNKHEQKHPEYTLMIHMVDNSLLYGKNNKSQVIQKPTGSMTKIKDIYFDELGMPYSFAISKIWEVCAQNFKVDLYEINSAIIECLK